MLCEIDSLTAFPPQIFQILGSLGEMDHHIKQIRASTVFYLYVFYLYPLESNCTVYKDFCGYIWSLFNIIQFLLDASHFHIYQITNCVVMRDLPIFLSNIINVYLPLLCCGYNSPLYDSRKVEYQVSTKDRLDWCGLNSAVTRFPYQPCYRCQGLTPWKYSVKYLVTNIFGNKHI